MIKLGEVVMILDLHRQGLTVSAIARELGVDRKTVRRCIARGLEPPVYGPRKPRQRLIDPFVPYLRARVMAYPGLTGRRLLRELRERGYEGGYTAVTDLLRELRPAPLPTFEVRFETPPGQQNIVAPYSWASIQFFRKIGRDLPSRPRPKRSNPADAASRARLAIRAIVVSLLSARRLGSELWLSTASLFP